MMTSPPTPGILRRVATYSCLAKTSIKNCAVVWAMAAGLGCRPGAEGAANVLAECHPTTTTTWVLPRPQGNELDALWLSPTGQIWAVGRGGTIVHGLDT